MKIIAKERVDAKVIKKYDAAKTLCRKLIVTVRFLHEEIRGRHNRCFAAMQFHIVVSVPDGSDGQPKIFFRFSYR